MGSLRSLKGNLESNITYLHHTHREWEFDNDRKFKHLTTLQRREESTENGNWKRVNEEGILYNWCTETGLLTQRHSHKWKYKT